MSRREEVEAKLLYTAQSDWPSADEAAEYRHLSLALTAERDERDEVITRLLEMYVPANDDNGNEPFYCECCGWTGFDVGIGGDRPEDEYPTCAECGDAVDEITKYNRIFLAAQYRRACEIAGRAE